MSEQRILDGAPQIDVVREWDRLVDIAKAQGWAVSDEQSAKMRRHRKALVGTPQAVPVNGEFVLLSRQTFELVDAVLRMKSATGERMSCERSAEKIGQIIEDLERGGIVKLTS